MEPIYLLVAALVLSLVLYQVNARQASPILAIFNRWLRWLIFGFGLARILIDLGLTQRPYWMLSLTFLAVYFLIETVYRWLEITALSLSPIPLFPRFVENERGDEWPTDKRFLKERDWLRAKGFTVVQSLRAEMAAGIHLRTSFYQDPSRKLRMQVMFLPQPGGNIVMCASISSLNDQGARHVTDNLHLPFAGDYPAGWRVVRRPWRRRLPSIFKVHCQRVNVESESMQEWPGEPLAEMNALQHDMERINTELGYLRPPHEREEHGKMTDEARYRVWKETWWLNYFGRSARYF